MSKSTKQSSENKPPAWAAPLFAQSAGEAQRLYNSGSGGNVYQGQTVANLSDTTQGGIQGIKDAAGSWNMPNYGNMLQQAGGPSAAQNYLTDYASGKFLKEGNPYYRERLMNEIGDSNALVQSQFSGSGRYGSGANAGVLAKNTNNMLLQGLESDYNRQQANQLQAVGMLDQQRNQGIANQLNIGNQAFQNRLQGATAQMGAGQLQDQNNQAKLQANYAKWLATDMKDWTRLGLLQSAAAGSAGNYGTNVQTQTQPFNPFSAIGGIGSLFTKSDARLKENIEPVGYERGHVLWEFSYLGSPERFRGVMAQMVIDDDPDAVLMEADGFYAVDYERLGLEMEAV